MTLSQFITRWNDTWGYDFWWRKKYNIPFGSKKHLSANQIDIAFDYIEDKLAEKSFNEYSKQEKNKTHLAKTGEWIKPTKVNEKEQKELFDKVDISKL